MAEPYLPATLQGEISEVEMKLAIVEAEANRSEALDLDQLQLDQFKHDELYHREIARLTTQDRLKHMALHFAKYAGNLAERFDEETVRKTVTDTFVIAVSTANILNVRLSDPLNGEQAPEIGEDSFERLLTIHAGRMAAACEKLDHLEDFPFRPVIRDSALALFQAAIGEATRRGWNIGRLARDRLAAVKQKMIFHGRV
jgi:hypothetical protein